MMKKIFTLSILGLTLVIIASAACVSASSIASTTPVSASSFIIKVQVRTLSGVQNVKADQVMVWEDYNFSNWFKATFDEQPGHNYYKVDLPADKTYTIDILKDGYKEKIVYGVSIANGEIAIILNRKLSSSASSSVSASTASTLTALPLLRSI